MNNELVKASDFGIEEKTATELTVGLTQVLEERKLLIDEFETVSKLEISEESIPMFRELRLKIQRNRTQGINQWHKACKEYFLRGGQFLDAIRRKELLVNENMEKVLLDGEKHLENIKKALAEELQRKRVSILSEFVEDANEKDFSHLSDDDFETLLEVKKKQYNDRIEAEKQAEIKRIEEQKAVEAERLRIQAENKRLKLDAEERERIYNIERQEREAKEEAKQAEEAKRQAELNKGDESKLNDLISDLNNLKTKYSFKSEKNQKVYANVFILIDKVITFIQK